MNKTVDKFELIQFLQYLNNNITYSDITNSINQFKNYLNFNRNTISLKIDYETKLFDCTKIQKHQNLSSQYREFKKKQKINKKTNPIFFAAYRKFVLDKQKQKYRNTSETNFVFLKRVFEFMYKKTIVTCNNVPVSTTLTKQNIEKLVGFETNFWNRTNLQDWSNKHRYFGDAKTLAESENSDSAIGSSSGETEKNSDSDFSEEYFLNSSK